MSFKAFQEENLAIRDWVKYMKTKLELLGLGNVTGNIYRVVSVEISKEIYQSEHNFFSETRNCLLHTKVFLQLHRQ